MQLVTQPDQATAQWLDAELEDVESRFAAELVSDLSCVDELVAHVEQYRGKMLRPQLVLTCAMACPKGKGKLTDAHRVLATVVEMVHMATLVHDDILDEAQTRRHGRTVNYLEGNEVAIMLGDYMISHAYHLCSSLGSQTISRSIAETTNTVCEGELLQLANRRNWALDEQTYFEIIRRKTATLCGCCGRLAAILWGHEGTVADSLCEYGEKVGIAFQIVDDLLDLTGAEDTVGKTVGRDLEKGKLTLPLIRHLSTADMASQRQMADALDRFDFGGDSQSVVQIREWITESGAVDYANAWAGRLIQQAKAGLESLPDSRAKSLLVSMADAVLTRRF